MQAPQCAHRRATLPSGHRHPIAAGDFWSCRSAPQNAWHRCRQRGLLPSQSAKILERRRSPVSPQHLGRRSQVWPPSLFPPSCSHHVRCRRALDAQSFPAVKLPASSPPLCMNVSTGMPPNKGSFRFAVCSARSAVCQLVARAHDAACLQGQPYLKSSGTATL